jgi:hypothetical protein
MTTEVVATPINDALAEFLSAGRASAALDPNQAALDMVQRILNAETVEDVLKRAEAIHARELVDQTIVLTGVRFNESDLKADGPGFYALLEIVDENGEAQVVTCGAVTVMAQAWKLNKLGALPMRVVLREAEKETKNGFRPMHLEPVASF